MIETIEGLFQKDQFDAKDRNALESFLDQLDDGTVRAAERGVDGQWKGNTWGKKGILFGFRMGVLVDRSIEEYFRFLA